MKSHCVMPTCNFCYQKGFVDLDEVYSHQVIVTSDGKSICSKLLEWGDVIDSSGSDELFPLRVIGKKYAPKNHDGRFIVYTAQGQLAKDPTKTGKNYLHYHMLHGLSPILENTNIRND